MIRRVLLTSSGAKFNVINSLLESLKLLNQKVDLILGDANPNARSLLLFPSMSVVTPKWGQQDIGNVLDFLKEQSISFIIPSSDRDVDFFSRHKPFLQMHGVNIMVADYLNIINVLDKLKFYEEYSSIFPIIPTASDLNVLDSELFAVKERFGYGSIAARTQMSRDMAATYGKSLDVPIFQPHIFGTEYTVDVYLSPKHGVLGSIVRERVEVKDGESKLIKVVSDRGDIREIAESFAQSAKMLGHVNVQMFDSSKELNVIECNPRIGGGSSISMKCGLNSIAWFILECDGIDPRMELPFCELKPKGFFLRYEQEKYIDVRF